MVLSILGNNLTYLWVCIDQLSEQMHCVGKVSVLNHSMKARGGVECALLILSLDGGR